MLTHAMIRNDILMLINKMRTTEMQIPSLWQCFWPGLLLTSSLPAWAFICSGSMKTTYMYLAVCLMLTFIAGQLRGKLLSIPDSMKSGSVTIKLLKNKISLYTSTFVLINIIAGLLCATNQITYFDMACVILPSVIIPFFAFIVDMGRFDITLLQAAFSAWLAGESIDNHITQVEIPNSPTQLQPTEDK